MSRWSERRKVTWLAFAAGVLAGCNGAPEIPGDGLVVAPDASGKKKSAASSDDAPEGQSQDSTELGQGTKTTDSAPPAPANGDDGAASDPPAQPPAPSAAPAACASDGDCDYGTICLAARCVAGCYTSADCPVGESCASGMCRASVPTSTPPPSGTSCVSDGQCNPGVNGSGQICSAQGSCVPGCHLDNQCPGTLVCANGACR